MNNWSLRTRLMFFFAIPVTALLIISFIASTIGRNTSFALEEVVGLNLPLVRSLEELKFAGSRLISSTNEWLLDHTLSEDVGEEAEEEGEEGGELDQIEEAVTTYNENLRILRDLLENTGDGDDAEFLSPIETTGQTLIAISNNIVALSTVDASPEETSEAREALEEVEVEFLAALDEAVEHELLELNENRDNVESSIVSAITTARTIVGIAVVIMATLAAYLFVSINRPINKLREAAEQFSEGRVNARANLNTKDELGKFGQAFDTMAGRISHLVSDLEGQVTVAQEARTRAERSDQVKSAFLASMSHELRTPLNAIINFTRFVVDGDTGPVNESQTELLNEVVGSAKHLLDLINDVLDMSKIEAGSLTLFVEDNVDLNALVDTAVTTGRSLLADKPIRLETAIEEGLPLMRADRQRILQILLNIVSNACKFTEEGQILVSAKQRDGEVVISVADTGPGIAVEDQPEIFEAFKQTSTGLRQGGGTGLGMPIARSLAEAHGGRLWVDSAVGVGTTFYVALPVKSEELVPVLA